jgi:hypothetical protein
MLTEYREHATQANARAHHLASAYKKCRSCLANQIEGQRTKSVINGPVLELSGYKSNRVNWLGECGFEIRPFCSLKA